MALYFLDSHIIIKYYYTEPGSTWVRNIVDDKTNVCLISEIALPVVAAALAQLHENQHFERQFLNDAFQRFEDAVANGVFVSQLLTSEILYRAALVALQHSIKADDALQLASALITQETIRTTLIFVSRDKRVLDAGVRIGLRTENPSDHITPEDHRK